MPALAKLSAVLSSAALVAGCQERQALVLYNAIDQPLTVTIGVRRGALGDGTPGECRYSEKIGERVLTRRGRPSRLSWNAEPWDRASRVTLDLDRCEAVVVVAPGNSLLVDTGSPCADQIVPRPSHPPSLARIQIVGPGMEIGAEDWGAAALFTRHSGRYCVFSVGS